MANFPGESSKDMNIKYIVTLRPSVICAFHGKIGSEGHSGLGACMLIHLHKQATTTPKVRAAIQASAEPASVLTERLGTTEQTVCKWRHRNTVHDRSHVPHRLQTTLPPAQETVVLAVQSAACFLATGDQ